MSPVIIRALVLLSAMLALNGALLSAMALGARAPLSVASVLLSFAVLAGTVLAGYFALAPLRADLNAVQRAVAERGPSPVEHDAPRAAETEALLAGLLRLRARMDELEKISTKARNEAEEAERLRASFLAAMGHDLRGPLNSILGFAELLVMPGVDAVAPSQRASVDIIRRRASDLLVLLDQILDWAKFEAGQIDLELEPLSLSSVITEAASEAMMRSAERGLYVQCSVADDLPAVRGDRQRLQQALLGLLDHGTRAPDRPRVTLSAWLARDERSKLSVRIEVRDPSLCIREADHQSFFEALRPSYAPSGKRVAGLGLGPALARALIRAHGGEVWFSSQADTGTTFAVELPTSVR